MSDPLWLRESQPQIIASILFVSGENSMGGDVREALGGEVKSLIVTSYVSWRSANGSSRKLGSYQQDDKPMNAKLNLPRLQSQIVHSFWDHRCFVFCFFVQFQGKENTRLTRQILENCPKLSSIGGCIIQFGVLSHISRRLNGLRSWKQWVLKKKDLLEIATKCPNLTKLCLHALPTVTGWHHPISASGLIEIYRSCRRIETLFLRGVECTDSMICSLGKLKQLRSLTICRSSARMPLRNKHLLIFTLVNIKRAVLMTLCLGL